MRRYSWCHDNGSFNEHFFNQHNSSIPQACGNHFQVKYCTICLTKQISLHVIKEHLDNNMQTFPFAKFYFSTTLQAQRVSFDFFEDYLFEIWIS